VCGEEEEGRGKGTEFEEGMGEEGEEEVENGGGDEGDYGFGEDALYLLNHTDPSRLSGKEKKRRRKLMKEKELISRNARKGERKNNKYEKKTHGERHRETKSRL